MPEEKKDEMGAGCVVVARERPTTRDGVVVAITGRSWVTRSSWLPLRGRGLEVDTGNTDGPFSGPPSLPREHEEQTGS
jgi:hypothetical protein